MILPDWQLHKLCHAGFISPYTPAHVNPASIDLTLGDTIRTPRWYWQPVLWRLAYKLNLPRWSAPREFDTYLLKPGEFVLCSSMEITHIPDDMIAILFSKSSTVSVSSNGSLALRPMAILDLVIMSRVAQTGRGNLLIARPGPIY